MSGVSRVLEWDRQASLGIGLGQRGDLARGLVLVINGNNPSRNLANDVAVTALNDMGAAAVGTSIGLAQPSSAAKGVRVDSSRLLAGSGGNFTGMTVVIVANPPNAGGWLMGLCLSAQTGNEWYVGWGTQLSGSSSAGTFNINTWSGTGVDVFGVCDGKDHVFAATFPEGAGTTASAYVDGVKTTGTVANSLPNTNSAAYVGGYWANGYAVNGFRQALTLGWNRELSEKEIAEVTRNPWQLFAPEQVSVPMAGGGGGPAALAGAATAGASATGALSTAIPILGAAVSGATASGSLSTAISLAGASATISASAAGNLSATIRLAGDAVAGSLAAGGLTTGIPLAGGGSVGGAGTGDLSTGSGLAGAGAAGVVGTGILTTQITLSGAAIAQAIASGALTTTPTGLAGDGTSSSSGSGALSTGIPLAGAAAVSVVGAGGLVTAIPLAGAATVAVSATGDLVVSLGLAGAALISAIGSGALLTSITLNGAAVTGAVGAGALSGAALHASPWRTVTSLARVRSVRATARVRRCIAGVR